MADFMELPGANFGEVKEGEMEINFDDLADEDEDKVPEDVIAMLGFDPSKEDAE